MRAAERVRRPGHLDDDHLHQLRVVAVGVDDEAGDPVELLARRQLVIGVDLVAGGDQQRPALAEQLGHHRFLRAEVVVDEPVGDARPRRRCRRRGSRGSPAARRPGSPPRGSPAACRPRSRAPSGHHRRQRAVGLRTAVRERGKLGRGSSPDAQNRGRRWRSRRRRRPRRAPHPRDRRSSNGPMTRNSAAPRRPDWRRSRRAWFSIARARRRTSQ